MINWLDRGNRGQILKLGLLCVSGMASEGLQRFISPKETPKDVGLSTSCKIFLLGQQTAGLSVGHRAIFSSQKVS